MDFERIIGYHTRTVQRHTDECIDHQSNSEECYGCWKKGDFKDANECEYVCKCPIGLQHIPIISRPAEGDKIV